MSRGGSGTGVLASACLGCSCVGPASARGRLSPPAALGGGLPGAVDLPVQLQERCLNGRRPACADSCCARELPAPRFAWTSCRDCIRRTQIRGSVQDGDEGDPYADPIRMGDAPIGISPTPLPFDPCQHSQLAAKYGSSEQLRRLPTIYCEKDGASRNPTVVGWALTLPEVGPIIPIVLVSPLEKSIQAAG